MTIDEALQQRNLWAKRIIMSNGGMLACMLLLPVAIYANAVIVLCPFMYLAADAIYHAWKGYNRLNDAIKEWEREQQRD